MDVWPVFAPMLRCQQGSNASALRGRGILSSKLCRNEIDGGLWGSADLTLSRAAREASTRPMLTANTCKLPLPWQVFTRLLASARLWGYSTLSTI